jgi:hypothetical protein
MLETTITLETLATIPVVSLGMSLLIQFLKGAFPGADPRLITLGMSLAFGAAYWWLSDTSLLVSIVGILGAASVIYGFILKPQPSDMV